MHSAARIGQSGGFDEYSSTVHAAARDSFIWIFHLIPPMIPPVQSKSTFEITVALGKVSSRVRLRIMSENWFLRCMVSGFCQTWFLPVSTLLNNNKTKIAPSSLNSNKIVKIST